jgi:hypothetical protein
LYVVGEVVGFAGVGEEDRGQGGSVVSIGGAAKSPLCVWDPETAVRRKCGSPMVGDEDLRDDRRKIGPARGIAFSPRCSSRYIFFCKT